MLDSRRVSAVVGLPILLAVCVGATDVSESPAPTTGNEQLMLEHLPGLVLTKADFRGELAGSVETDAKSIPNEVMANTGGDGKPVTLDDPDHPEMASSPEPTPSCVPVPVAPFSVGSLVWDASLSFTGGYIAAQGETAACLGIDLDVQDGQRDPATQIAAIERFIEQGKDLIIAAALEPDSLLPVLQAANEAGVPFIATVVPLGEDVEVVTFVGYDDHAIGRLQGEMLVAAVGEEARVGLILGADGWYAAIEQGLTDYLAEHPGIEVVERQVTEGDEAGLLAVVEEWLATYPPGELAAIVIEDHEVVSAAQLAADHGRSDVETLAGWYTDPIDTAITDERIHGTILQDPRPIGVASIQDAYRWLTGDHDAVARPEHLLAPTIVTRENVDDYPAWEARPVPTPAPIATAEPEPTPPSSPLTSGDLDRLARRMCVRARPDDLYSVRARAAPARAARGMDTAHLVLVEYRDLRGARRREPRIKADSVYDLRWQSPFDWRSAGDIDVLACLALRATRRETWQNTTTGRRYTVDAADAVIWMVDATDARMIGRAWLRRVPKPRPAYPGAPMAIAQLSDLRIGDHGPGIMPPSDDEIIRDVRRFLRG